MKKSMIILSSALSALSAHSAVLSGTGANLPIAGPHGAIPGVAHSTSVTGSTWTGTWSGPVPADWMGTFNVTGPTTGSGMMGTTRYNFSTLPTGTLPAGTLFLLGDVDSSADVLDFRAWDSSGNLINLWLNDTVATYGSGTGVGGTPVVGNMPSWTWDSVAQSYNIDGGTTFGFNPTLGIALETNQDIATLEVVKLSFSYGFALRAPSTVPEPSSLLLCAFATGGLVMRRKRTKNSTQ